jgi:hypothetical protein
MDRNEIQHDPCHQGFSSGASKMISEPMVCSAQTVHLSCVRISSISKRTESSFHLILVTLEYHRVCPTRFLSWWYVWCKPSGASKMKRNEHPLEPRHLEVPSGAPKMISEPMVRLAQTMQLSCTDTNTVSKWTETRFHMTHVTKEFNRVRPKWFLSLWCDWPKPCTFLAPTLTQCLNRPKWDSIWPKSPSSYIGCIQNDFRAYGTLGAKRAPILRQD